MNNITVVARNLSPVQANDGHIAKPMPTSAVVSRWDLLFKQDRGDSSLKIPKRYPEKVPEASCKTGNRSTDPFLPLSRPQSNEQTLPSSPACRNTKWHSQMPDNMKRKENQERHQTLSVRLRRLDTLLNDRNQQRTTARFRCLEMVPEASMLA